MRCVCEVCVCVGVCGWVCEVCVTGNAARCAGMLSPKVLLDHYKQSSKQCT